MKKILFACSEAMPFAATGGLGDVAGSLPRALAENRENDVRVVLPLYSAVGDEWRRRMKTECVFTVPLAWRQLYCGVKSLKKGGVTYYFIDNEYYFRREGLYGHYDDGERFAYFSMAVLASLGQLGFFPDVIHANDWQTALIPVYLDCIFRARPGYEKIRTVFTIHNIEYQGQYHFGILGDVFALDYDQYDRMDFGGGINLMKAAIVTADRVTTVSPRYAEEICTPAFGRGLDGVLRENRHKLSGILNGIDCAYYNPGADPAIVARYNWQRPAPKTENKLALQKNLDLPVSADIPLLAVISRLVSHKGLDLLQAVAGRLIGDHPVQLVVLGRGDEAYERFFSELAGRYPRQVRALLRYDRDLAKRIYAAADLFLMPSRTEPCGLSQMIASRYGAIPVIHETGGLADSIHGYYEDENGDMHGNGFTFANYSADELLERTLAAVELWRDRARRARFVKKIMRVDFSWERSAASYQDLYNALN